MGSPTQGLRREMKKIFNTRHYDWLGLPIKNCNRIQFHHTFKNVYGVRLCMEIGSLISESGHLYLHDLERTNRTYYNNLNKLFMKLCLTKKPPTIEYWEELKDLHLSYDNQKMANIVIETFITPYYYGEKKLVLRR